MDILRGAAEGSSTGRAPSGIGVGGGMGAGGCVGRPREEGPAEEGAENDIVQPVKRSGRKVVS